MENLGPTIPFAAVLEERRRVLRRELVRALPAGCSFIWELGSGHGHFLTAYAQAHPEKLCLGVDLVGERVGRALRKRDRARLTNLHFFQADARLFLEVLPPEASIGATFILFPDPWPKLRHHKHRIIQPAFLATLADRSALAGRVYFRTDFEPYFEQARGTLAAHPRWRLREEPWPFEFETVFQSRAARYRSLIAEPVGSLAREKRGG